MKNEYQDRIEELERINNRLVIKLESLIAALIFKNKITRDDIAKGMEKYQSLLPVMDKISEADTIDERIQIAQQWNNLSNGITLTLDDIDFSEIAVNENGAPCLPVGKVIEAINKLPATYMIYELIERVYGISVCKPRISLICNNDERVH